MKFTTLVVTAVLAFAANAQASKYGMAGCGLGSLVLNDQPGKVQIVAATLNDLGSQTSAITTGSSNCREQSRSEAINQYIENNTAALKADISRGQGETLEALLAFSGCNESTKNVLKSNFSKIFETENQTSTEVSRSLTNVLRTQNLCDSLS
jgi:hypothetical protein